MNPTFATMSIQELRTYVLSHREDTSALHTLIDGLRPTGGHRTRPTPPRTQYPCPNTPENIEIMRQAIQEKLGR